MLPEMQSVSHDGFNVQRAVLQSNLEDLLCVLSLYCCLLTGNRAVAWQAEHIVVTHN